MDTTLKQRHRRKRRSFKTLRSLMLVLGCLSAPTGIVMAGWGYSESNSLPLNFGLLNIATSAICLLIWALLRRQQTTPPAPIDAEASLAGTSRAGMALLVSLLMLALLSGMALQALVASGIDLRFARERHTACLLKTAGTDAVWMTLREAAKLDPDTLARYDKTISAGPGIEAQTSLREVNRAALPPPMLLQKTPLFGRFFSVTTRITHDKTAREIRALACRMPTGELRLLSWTEPF
jgi:hypothetical protein